MGEAFPRGSGQEGLVLEGAPVLLKGSLGPLWLPTPDFLTFKELQTTEPWCPISLLFFTIHNNLISKGAVSPE